VTTFDQVDPESFISTKAGTPEHGRGAWTRTGIDFDYRYRVHPKPKQRIGNRAEVSLDHWAVAAGSYAIAKRLNSLGYLNTIDESRLGVYNLRIARAVKRFQADNHDPDGNVKLTVDGTVGRSDARALFTPLITAAETKYGIPRRLLLGETNHESALDPGAIGYFIFYPDYRGVDRGMSQINSKANEQVSWMKAYDPEYSIDWSAKRMRGYFDLYHKLYPERKKSVLWLAAVCAHNNPWAASQWAKTGVAPTDSSAHYVNSVRNARF
jgi:hypothetical protein